MTRENSSVFTDRNHPKARNRSLFVALQADAKRYPGGISALAHEMGMDPRVLADKINPNCFDKVLKVGELLDLIERLESVRAVNVIASYVDRTTVSVPAVTSPAEVMRAFVALTRRAADVMASGAKALEDERLDAPEREELLPLLDDLINSAVAFRSFAQGPA